MRGPAMNPPEEFRKQADECRRMARLTRDHSDRAMWKRMADRWLVCARLAEDDLAVAHSRAGERKRFGAGVSHAIH